jgi:tetratricopeptide (TPR) repeat protein
MADCAATSSEGGLTRDGLAEPRAALAREPLDTAAMHRLATGLLDRQRSAEAVAVLSFAASLRAEPALLSDLGTALIQIGQPQQAEAAMRRALAADRAFYPALCNLGALLLDTGKPRDAEAILRDAIRSAPERPEAVGSLAKALLLQGNQAQIAADPERAEALYRAAAAEQPEFATAHYNLGVALLARLRVTESIAAFRHALALAPADDGTAFALALALLMTGNEAEGLVLHERRVHAPFLRPNFTRRPALPLWQLGDCLSGKRVLVLAEQGTGDIIQHARFLPALASIAAEVTLEVPWLAAGLFRDLPGPARVITLSDPDPQADIAVPLLSLQRAVGQPVAPPYLHAWPERQARWADWLDRGPPGRKIGLACSGDPRHGRDSERSIPLAAFAPLLDLPGATFVLVQPEIRDTDRDFFDQADNLRSPVAALTDYADTAGLLAELDLLVSIDTSTAHLAGAMARPVWTLITYSPDYRWGLGRDDTTWYPTMRLFRQDRAGDWDTVIARVRNELERDG